MNNNILLEVKGLKKYFVRQKSLLGKPLVFLKAVDDVSFKLESGKTIGVVGESGCGKTTLGRTILQLYDTTGGKSLYYGHTLESKLPSYYLQELAKFGSYKSKLNKAIAAIETFSYKMSLAEINKKTEELQEMLLANTESKELKNQLNAYKSLYEILNNASIRFGGLILQDQNPSEALLKIAKLKNQLYQLEEKISLTNDEAMIEELNNEATQVSNEIANYKEIIDNIYKSIIEEISSSNLFKDLELRIETGIDLAKLNKNEMRKLRTEIQLIFQDPYSSLPPRMTVGQIISEAVKVHKIVPEDKVDEHVHDIMKKCGLQPSYYVRYPHEFSGGQRQRICIARALAVNPKLVICDEPVSALDVSIQAQIINLLKDLQNELGLTYMFISHDLSVVKYITDSIIVMYLGNMMEIGNTDDIFKNPLHPYTQALFSAVPVPDPDAKMQRIILKGDIPSPVNPPKGCKFHTRCERCMSVCKLLKPEFIDHGNNHVVACHLYNEEIMSNLAIYDQKLAEIEANLSNEEK